MPPAPARYACDEPWFVDETEVKGRGPRIQQPEPAKISAHAPLRARTESLISTTTLGRAHSRRSARDRSMARDARYRTRSKILPAALRLRMFGASRADEVIGAEVRYLGGG